ncbi:MAG: NADP-dependent malic enzyme [Minisyncoccia bacterium]|jgi:malate dehydrogenase (oxaloacetate-decarboxylating)
MGRGDIFSESLAFHKKHRGKLETKSKVSLKNKRDLSLSYTPGVGAVSSAIGKNRKLAREYTLKRNTVAIVSDGSAILGLGNLGAEAAIPVMEGKAVLFKEFAGVDAFPICLVTQDTEKIIEAVKNIAPVFGGINLEDISAPRCFEIEERLKKELQIPVLHDDQHGTATVVLAALINSLKLRGLKKEKAKLVINGAGAAGNAVSQLLLKFGFKNIILVDSHGAIYDGRKNLDKFKKFLAKRTNKAKINGDLARCLEGSDIFIGVSRAGLLKPEMIKAMNPKPIIFALANPVPEIMPDLAKKAGAYIVATGRSDFPNQLNNVLAFPGIFRGALDHGVRRITDEMLVKAARNLAATVKNPNPEKILPDVFDKKVAKTVALAIQ